MKKLFQTYCFAAAVLALGAPGVLAQAETPTYSNAEVISVDMQRRIVVLRTPQGTRETLVLDDLLASTGGIRAGDRVIVTVRGGPGRRRISAMTVMTAGPSAASAATPVPSPRPGRTETERAEARTRYAAQVASISRQAQPVDGLWSGFVTACAVKPVSNDGGGRDWFGLWDGRVQADYSGGQCRDLFNQIVNAGEGVKKAMAAAESGLEEFLTPGQVRDIRTTYAMNWDGWLLPAPQRREP
jgi:hypothetical protein